MKVVRRYGIRAPAFQSCHHVGGPHARRAAAGALGRIPGECRCAVAGTGRAGGPPGGGGQRRRGTGSAAPGDAQDPRLGGVVRVLGGVPSRGRGYRFVSFRNGREALDALLALDVAGLQPLLLLDVDLPALDGYSILETLTRERPGQYRVVFTTVHGDESEQLRGLEAGALDYLVKPISLRVALEETRRWVGR